MTSLAAASTRRGSESDDRRAAFAISIVTAVLAVLAIGRLWTFQSSAFDSGYIDNVLWLISHGHGDVTAISGVHHFADHVSPLLLLALPVYAVVPRFGLEFLLIAQAVSVGLVFWAVWLIGGSAELDRRTRWVLLAVTMLGPGAYYAAMTEIHATGLALGPLAMTVALGFRSPARIHYWIWPLLAATARIELALAVVIAGGLLTTKGKRTTGVVAMAVGGTVAIAMAAWMALVPWDGTSISAHFAHLDVARITDLPSAFLSAPIDVLRPLGDHLMLASALTWLLLFMVIPPLRASRWILIAAPLLAIPILGSWPAADLSFEHYWHVLLPALATAAAFGLARDEALRKLFVMAAPIVLVAGWAVAGPFHELSRGFGLPPITRDTSADRAAVAVARADPEASVSAGFKLVPHLSDRVEVMVFPTPFACPSIPLAIFVPPARPPDIVIVDTRESRAIAEEDLPEIEATLDSYYEAVLVDGPITVYRIEAMPPPGAYDARCDPVETLTEITNRQRTQ